MKAARFWRQKRRIFPAACSEYLTKSVELRWAPMGETVGDLTLLSSLFHHRLIQISQDPLESGGKPLGRVLALFSKPTVRPFRLLDRMPSSGRLPIEEPAGSGAGGVAPRLFPWPLHRGRRPPAFHGPPLQRCPKISLAGTKRLGNAEVRGRLVELSAGQFDHRPGEEPRFNRRCSGRRPITTNRRPTGRPARPDRSACRGQGQTHR